MRRRARVGNESLSINVLKLFGMASTAYVVIVIRKDLPSREQQTVLMREDNSSAIQGMLNCKGCKDDERAGGIMRILGALSKGEVMFLGQACGGRG